MSTDQAPDTVQWLQSPAPEEHLGAFLGEIVLPFAPEAVGRARRFVHFIADTWRMASATGIAELCVSELVTNAYTHTTPNPASPLRLVVLRLGSRLRYEVHDPSRTEPSKRDPGVHEETGRGMQLLGTFADQHGTYPTSQGKAVWFELATWRADEEAER
ncbi:ATP-binding protein [Spirillospora sp. NPDC047279]|uniref:ATP-binding protein n=1 Tax=Spirillospora sp. NPDC047279 TaxID=3155478 RepID=UPI0033FD02AC